jgi:LPS-assembly lipoprotein
MLRLAAAGLVALTAAACFRPLYGPTASGARTQDLLAAIEVPPLAVALGQERVAHHLRSELVYELNGSGEPRPKRYKLVLGVSERLQTPIVDSAAGRALAATLFLDVRYTLLPLEGGQPVFEGQDTIAATYDRSAQRFANVRAARDAQIRASKEMARLIRLRLASVLATRS